METMMDGTPFNPNPTCPVPKCPHPTVARLYDPVMKKRMDLCFGHAKQTKHVNKENVHIVAVWNDYTLEDFDD